MKLPCPKCGYPVDVIYLKCKRCKSYSEIKRIPVPPFIELIEYLPPLSKKQGYVSALLMIWAFSAWFVSFAFIGGAFESGSEDPLFFFFIAHSTVMAASCVLALVSSAFVLKKSYKKARTACKWSSILALAAFFGIIGFRIEKIISDLEHDYEKCPKCEYRFGWSSRCCKRCGWTIEKPMSDSAAQYAYDSTLPRSTRLKIVCIIETAMAVFLLFFSLEFINDPHYWDLGLFVLISCILAFVTVVLSAKRRFHTVALATSYISAAMGLIIIFGAVGFIAAFLIYKSKKEFKPVEKKLIRRSRGI
jgi:hypothetical protein